VPDLFYFHPLHSQKDLFAGKLFFERLSQNIDPLINFIFCDIESRPEPDGRMTAAKYDKVLTISALTEMVPLL